MRTYFIKLKIPSIHTNTIDHKSIVDLRKRLIAFSSIGLLCTLLIAPVTAKNGFNNVQVTYNIADKFETTEKPLDNITEDNSQVGDGQANPDISIITRGTEFQDIRNGSEGTEVEKIQQSLTDKGIYDGPINSKFGPLTETAVIEFQKKNGLATNGVVDQRLFTLICKPAVNTAIEGLKDGSEGEDVKELQQKLKEKGFYDGPIAGKFGPLTETAVKSFQKKVDIKIDGIVSTKVMNKLDAYKLPVTAVKKTEPSGKTSNSSVSIRPAANGVEMLDWSQVKNIFAIGLVASVYDVRSGITYNVRSFSNGSHADVEPITANDTAIMLKTYGGAWKWDPRPVWVTVNGRIIAGSINGMPHGGDTNSNNNMNGQICIHFKGSTTHNGNLSFAKQHQDAVIEAWNAAKK